MDRNEKNFKELIQIFKQARNLNQKKENKTQDFLDHIRAALSNKSFSKIVHEEGKHKQKPLFCENFQLGCNCHKEHGYDSFCGSFYRCIKRIDRINTKQNKAKLMLLRIQNRYTLMVDYSDQNSFRMMVKKKEEMKNHSTNFKSTVFFNQQIYSIPFSDKKSMSTLNLCPSMIETNPSTDLYEFKDPRAIQFSSRCSGSDVQIEESKSGHHSKYKNLQPLLITNSQSSTSFTFRSNSQDLHRKAINEISEFADRDVRRTFQEVAYFKKDSTREKIYQLLSELNKSHQTIGYVQGMNYIAAVIVYHCPNSKEAFKVGDYLFKNLEMKKVYNFATFESFLTVFKKLFKCHLFDFYSYLENCLKTDFKLLMLDWFFCLCFTKVPLAFSHLLLENIVNYGWFFLYRLIINFFKLYFDKNMKDFQMFCQSKKKNFDFEVGLKNFHKTKIDWENLLNLSRGSALNDRIIENDLGVVTLSKFKKPLLILEN